MRKLLYTILALGFLTSSLMADLDVKYDATKYPRPVEKIEMPSLSDYHHQQMMKAKKDKSSLDLFRANIGVAFITQNNWYTLSGNATPIAYDPISGGTFISTNQLQLADGALLGTAFRMFYSTDLENWSGGDTLHVFEGPYWNMYPSIGIANVDESTNPGDVWYMITGRNLEYQVGINGINLQVKLGPEDDADVIAQSLGGPRTNNSPHQQNYGAFNVASHNVPGEEKIYFAGTLDPVDGLVDQYGYYGLLSFDMYNEDFGSRIVPEQWWTDKFREPGGISVSYNGPMSIDTDPSGNVYTGVDNFSSANPDFRLPGFSKSTDGGETWSEFNYCPQGVLDAWLQDNGLSNAVKIGLTAYTKDDMVVYGEDEVSYFAVRYLYEEPAPDSSVFVTVSILEFNYNGTAWSIRQITDMFDDFTEFEDQNFVDLSAAGNLRPAILYQNSTTTASLGARYGDTKQTFISDDNPIGWEVQASKTADGENIVVKWVEYTGIRELEDSVNVYLLRTNEQLIDDTLQARIGVLPTNDVHMSWRATDATSWNGKFNVTNDEVYYKFTWIPKVIPSVDNIPMVTNVTAHDIYGDDPDDDPSFIGFPYDMYQMWHNGFNQRTWVANVDGTQNAPEGNSIVNTVETNIEHNFAINNIFPNPASDKAQLTFTVEEASDVEINIHDGFGRVVKNIFNSSAAAGTQGFTFSTSELPSGAYYVTIIVGDKSATQILNVVK